jgi:hypothetical protein
VIITLRNVRDLSSQEFVIRKGFFLFGASSFLSRTGLFFKNGIFPSRNVINFSKEKGVSGQKHAFS